jgi:prevent-host-death family protein
MKRSLVVGSRELKTRLGHYLKRVRAGETILVTDRSEPVAELRPLREADPTRAALQKLAATGLVTLPTLPAPGRFQPVAARGASASKAVERDRDERG